MPLGQSIFTPLQERGGPFDGWAAIHLAAWRGDVEIVQTLIENGADLSLNALQNEVCILLFKYQIKRQR
jgi:hypothetical protein